MARKQLALVDVPKSATSPCPKCGQPTISMTTEEGGRVVLDATAPVYLAIFDGDTRVLPARRPWEDVGDLRYRYLVVHAATCGKEPRHA